MRVNLLSGFICTTVGLVRILNGDVELGVFGVALGVINFVLYCVMKD